MILTVREKPEGKGTGVGTNFLGFERYFLSGLVRLTDEARTVLSRGEGSIGRSGILAVTRGKTHIYTLLNPMPDCKTGRLVISKQ